jgi:dipeptidyl aminopeptidase/acylaminoacyl peptidase
MDGGESWQLTKAPEGVQQFVWRPGGSEIAFVSLDEAPKMTGPERHNRAFEAQHNHYLLQTGVRPAHLWLISANGGNARRLTSGTWSLPQVLPPSPPSSPPAFSPDGKQVALVKLETPYTGDADQSTIQVLDVDSGRMRALTGRAKNETQPVFSPDGRWIAHWWPRDGETRNVNEIHIAPVAGGASRSITRPLDRNVMRAMWMPDSRSMLVSANDGTGVGLWVQPVDGPARHLKMGKVVATTGFWLDASLGPKGEVVVTGAEPESASELYYIASPESQPVKLTEFNKWTSELEVGRTESIEWTGADGLRQDGVITYPVNFNTSRKYPLVLYIHGGPRSASKTSFAARAKVFASQGWLVFEPNYRGSDNLGNAFQAAIWNDAGAGPGRDVMSGVAELMKRGIVDETKMAVSGWSYGGYMTVWLLGNYPDKWKAAMAGAAVTDLEDQYNLGDSNVRRGSAVGGSPWTDAKRRLAYAEQSPITYAPRIKAPTLIMALNGDYRVTVTQSYQLYHALRDNGVPTQFIVYPLPGHSPTDPVHQRDVDRRWVSWLGKYLGGTEPASE